MSKETGGPAYPCKAYTGLMQEGLSIRDHFAGLAMQALIPRGHTYEATTGMAYLFADAMLREKNKP